MFNALAKLDKDGDGSFRMEDLMRVMEDQQQMSQIVQGMKCWLVLQTFRWSMGPCRLETQALV